MIVFIRGKILEKQPNSVIIDVNGIGYFCHITNNTFSLLPNKQQEVFLNTYFNVTENSQELYGFLDLLEKDLFMLLIGVSGIGPKTAINLLSAVSPEEFKKRLIASEVSMLTALPGIGPKTARRIIVELKDKFVKLDKDDLPFENENAFSKPLSEAIQALETLGYKTSIINKIVADLKISEKKNINTQEIIKRVLGKLR